MILNEINALRNFIAGVNLACDFAVANLQKPFLDLSAWAGTDLEGRTAQAMGQKAPLIYGGRITADNLVGEPDLLRLRGTYVAADMKSGSGYDGDEDDGKLKKHYAVQLAFTFWWIAISR